MQTLSLDILEQRIPRLVLGDYPTSLSRSRGLQRHIGGPELWFKRDDLISFGFGGNKVRGLEVIATEIVDQDCDVIVTGAGVQSNHVRASAALASFLGIDMTAVFWGQPTDRFDGNYRMSRMLGAQVFFTGDKDRASVDWGIDQVASKLVEQGRRPYRIPRGGACPSGVLGHVLAVGETFRQCREINLNPDLIIFATGSGGTHAGWLLGTHLLNLNWRVKSYSVSRPAAEVKQQIARLANEAGALIDIPAHFTPGDVLVDDHFIGEGYGIPSAEAADAIQLAARFEGILFDPTYTGKAMAGFLSEVKNQMIQDHNTVLFIHTGGEPAFFAGNGEWLKNKDSYLLTTGLMGSNE